VRNTSILQIITRSDAGAEEKEVLVEYKPLPGLRGRGAEPNREEERKMSIAVSPLDEKQNSKKYSKGNEKSPLFFGLLL